MGNEMAVFMRSSEKIEKPRTQQEDRGSREEKWMREARVSAVAAADAVAKCYELMRACGTHAFQYFQIKNPRAFERRAYYERVSTSLHVHIVQFVRIFCMPNWLSA